MSPFVLLGSRTWAWAIGVNGIRQAKGEGRGRQAGGRGASSLGGLGVVTEAREGSSGLLLCFNG